MAVSLTSCPVVRRRGPPPTSAHRPFGEGHHRTRGQGPLWREGAPGAGRPQDRHHLQRPTSWPSRCWPPGSPEASGDEWLHRASNRWPRFVVVYGRWPGPTLPRLSATARSAGMRLRSTLVVRRTCRTLDANYRRSGRWWSRVQVPGLSGVGWAALRWPIATAGRLIRRRRGGPQCSLASGFLGR
jgi:hypothetical protein